MGEQEVKIQPAGDLWLVTTHPVSFPRKGRTVIHYRTFRNADPPGLTGVWNACFTGRGAVALRGPTLMEYFTFAKPYFDPQGLIVAEDDGQGTTPLVSVIDTTGSTPPPRRRIVGFAHAGFGPDATGATLDYRVGILCALGVHPDYRRQGIGSELLRHAQDYIRGRGVQEFRAGPCPGLNPFTFGLYGGSQSPGFLKTDAAAEPFFLHHGYQVQKTILVMQRSLERSIDLGDGRFPAFRQRFEIFAGLAPRRNWYTECVLGPIELLEYRLKDKSTEEVLAHAALWEMETFGAAWNQHAVGLTDLHVVPEARRQGLAKFLLTQLLRHLHEHFFNLVEAQVPRDNAAMLTLLQSMDFQQVDVGQCFSRVEPPPEGETGEE